MAAGTHCRNCANLQGLMVQADGTVRYLARRLHRARDTTKVLAEIASVKADIAEYRAGIEACSGVRMGLAS